MADEADRRALILIAAERLCTHYGLQKTTVAGIAREASVAVGSVYLEFASKTSIVHELARVKHGQVLRSMRRAAMGQGSYRERFEAMMNARTQAFIQIACCHAHGHELLYAHCDGVRRARDLFMREQRELFADFLMAARDDSAFMFDDLDATIQSLTLAYAHFSPPLMATFPEERLMSSLAHMHRLILPGLTKNQVNAK